MNKTTININIYNKRLYFIVYKIKGKISKKNYKKLVSSCPTLNIIKKEKVKRIYKKFSFKD